MLPRTNLRKLPMQIDQLADLATVYARCSAILNGQNKLDTHGKTALRKAMADMDDLIINNVTFAINQVKGQPNHQIKESTGFFKTGEVVSEVLGAPQLPSSNTEEVNENVAPVPIAQKTAPVINSAAKLDKPKPAPKKKPAVDPTLMKELLDAHPSLSYLETVIDAAKEEIKKVTNADEYMVAQAKMIDKSSLLAQAATYVRKLPEADREKYSAVVNNLKLAVGNILASGKPAPAEKPGKPLSKTFQKLDGLSLPPEQAPTGGVRLR